MVAFLRWDEAQKPLVVVCNFSPIHRKGYRVGLPFAGTYQQVFNTDLTEFGGTGELDDQPKKSEPTACHDQPHSMQINLPPMASVIYRCARKTPQRTAKAISENSGTIAAKNTTPAKKATAAKKAAPEKKATAVKKAAAAKKDALLKKPASSKRATAAKSAKTPKKASAKSY